MNRMLGTAHWNGTVEGDPAVMLSYHGGATLWVFRDVAWEIYRSANSHREGTYRDQLLVGVDHSPNVFIEKQLSGVDLTDLR